MLNRPYPKDFTVLHDHNATSITQPLIDLINQILTEGKPADPGVWRAKLQAILGGKYVAP